MLNGASQIIGGIRGIHLDPFTLAGSQVADTVGFIMIVHKKPQKTFDILFISGPAVTASARMTADCRFPIDEGEVRSLFLGNRRASLIYLFLCPAHEIERFVTTLRMEPCLKIPIDPVHRKRIRSLIKATGCSQGILEQNVFLTDPPKIDLVDFNALEYVPAAPKTRFNGGRLLLYDLEKIYDYKARGAVPRYLRSEQKEGFLAKQTSTDRRSAEESPRGKGEAPAAASLEPEKTEETPAQNTNGKEVPPVKTAPAASIQPPAGDEGQMYIRIFQRLFRSFRHEASGHLGKKCEMVLGDAVHQVRLLAPGFDMDELTEGNAPRVLDIMDNMINRAPFLKRSKLRETALTLVADLYNKHFDLLEQRNLIDRVEQSYSQLRK